MVSAETHTFLQNCMIQYDISAAQQLRWCDAHAYASASSIAVAHQPHVKVLEAFHNPALHKVELGSAAQLLILPQNVLTILQHPPHILLPACVAVELSGQGARLAYGRLDMSCSTGDVKNAKHSFWAYDFESALSKLVVPAHEHTMHLNCLRASAVYCLALGRQMSSH